MSRLLCVAAILISRAVAPGRVAPWVATRWPWKGLVPGASVNAAQMPRSTSYVEHGLEIVGPNDAQMMAPIRFLLTSAKHEWYESIEETPWIERTIFRNFIPGIRIRHNSTNESLLQNTEGRCGAKEQRCQLRQGHLAVFPCQPSTRSSTWVLKIDENRPMWVKQCHKPAREW